MSSKLSFGNESEDISRETEVYENLSSGPVGKETLKDIQDGMKGTRMVGISEYERWIYSFPLIS